MIYAQLTDLLTGKKDAIKKKWWEDFMNTGCERASKSEPSEYLMETVDFILNDFAEIIKENYDKTKLCEKFSRFGYLGYEDHYAIHDLLSALSLLKKEIFRVIDRGGFYDSALDLHKMLQFHTNAVRMFDRANFYLAMGYEEAMRTQAKEHTGMEKILGIFRSKPKKEVVDFCSTCKIK